MTSTTAADLPRAAHRAEGKLHTRAVSRIGPADGGSTTFYRPVPPLAGRLLRAGRTPLEPGNA